jgi:hypothetical protein
MRPVLLALMILSTPCLGRKKECGCAIKGLVSEYTTDCKTTYLKNGGRLYWQFNCKSIWLTLENPKGRKYIIDTVPTELSGYTYRLGYQLVKEYTKTLLFRSGCPANGPCNFVLVDKSNGKVLKEFGELIYDHNTDVFYDFVLYFANPNTLGLYYINTKKEYKIPIDGSSFIAVVPEYQFGDIIVRNGKLSLSYDYDDNEKKRNLTIDLRKYHP